MHIFDSMKEAKDASVMDDCARNLFANFAILVKQSKLADNINFDTYLLLTNFDHPQQTIIFDYGFFNMLFMESFTGKVIPEFDNNDIPLLRKLLASDLIEARQNKGSMLQLMEEEFQKKRS